MILRRVRQRLGNRDWGSLFLDLMVVIVGIFLGLQASNWNEERVERAEDSLYLDRLLSDLVQMRDAIHARRESTQDVYQSALALFRALESCNSDVYDPAGAAVALGNHQRLFTPVIFRSAYDEMQAAGALARLTNDELKHSLSRAYARLEYFRSQVEFMRRDLSAASRILWEYVDFSFQETQSLIREIAIVDDLDLMSQCDNRMVRNAIWELVDSNRDWLTHSRRALELIEVAISAIESEIG